MRPYCISEIPQKIWQCPFWNASSPVVMAGLLFKRSVVFALNAGLAELGRLLEVSCPEPFAQVEVESHSPYVVGGEVLGLVSRFGSETDAEYAEVVDALGEP